MGLPLWRDPDDIRIKKEREGTAKPDPTAAARSPIRRRSPPAARRRSSYYPSRQPFPPRFERSPPPSVGFNGLQDARRGYYGGVPPVSTLLESADTRSPFPRPRYIPRFRGRPDAATSIAEDQRSLVDTGRRHDSHARVEAEAQRLRAEILPGDWEDWSEEDRETWLEDNNIPRYLYSRDQGVPTSALASTSHRQSSESLLPLGRPYSRDGPYRSALPTPPHDESVDADSLFIPPGPSETIRRANAVRRQHPLSRSWRPDSPVNGLGDRNRSPTPVDNWENLRDTITPVDNWENLRDTIPPDETLPTASFASTAASMSFHRNNSFSTSVTDPDYTASSYNSRGNSQDDENSVSSVDPDDLVCEDDETAAASAFAELVYRDAQLTSEGRERIRQHSTALDAEQNRFAHYNEPRTVELGFRLIEEALETPDRRTRVFQLSESLPIDLWNNLRLWIIHRDLRSHPEQRRTRMAHTTLVTPRSPLETPRSPPTENPRAAVRRQVHDFFGRFTAEETLSASQRETMRMAERTSPPPRYESQTEVSISNEEPIAHPVASLPGSRYPSRPASPPSARSERDMTDALLSGDEQDLTAIRRVVERLAQREDVPEEFWMSMGLNLSRTRARSPSWSAERATDPRRVRTGRIARERNAASRL